MAERVEVTKAPTLSGPGIRRYFQHLRRPWVWVSGLLGTAFFVWGASYFDAPTWDVGVSYLMSALCIAFAPCGFLLLREGARKPSMGIAGAALVYLIASGSYEIYNTIRMGQHPITYWYNLGFSVPVTLIAGMVWSYDGSLADLWREISVRPES